MRTGIIDAYREFLPDITDASPVVSLCEGATPLVRAPRLARWVVDAAPEPFGLDLHLKIDGANPTGSFKDRGMTMAVTRAVETGKRVVVCASTGNTSASAAAYAARAGIACAVLLPRGEVALGKLSQALIHGAQVVSIDGNFDDALRLVREIADSEPVELVNSVNPVRIEGQKTAAFEIVDALGDAPDFHALPVGNAGNITAYARGFREFRAAGRASRLPVLLGFQAAGAAPLVVGHPVERPETIATAIRIGRPASWESAIAARDESGGRIDAVSDDAILEAYRAAAGLEGVFAEPASVAPIAGLRQLASQGYFAPGSDIRVSVTLTGHGLKDPDRAVKTAGAHAVEAPARRDAIVALLQRLWS